MEKLVPENSKELLLRLREISQELNAELMDLTDEDANFSPGEGEWSIKEVVCHLRDAEQIWYKRISRILQEDEPFLRAFNPDELATEHDYKSQNWVEVRTAFEQARTANL